MFNAHEMILDGYQTKGSGEVALEALCTEACFKSNKEDKWYSDSGCARHMTSDKSLVSCLTSKLTDVSPKETTGKIKLLVKVT